MKSPTKKYKNLANLFSLISFVLLVFPMIYYGANAFIIGTTVQKLAFGGLATASIILTLFNTLAKINMRSPLWLMLLGVYFILKNIMPLIIMISIATILDEFIFTPLAKNTANYIQ